MKLKFNFLVFFIGFLVISCQSQKKEINSDSLKLPKMVYPKYRIWMSPDNGDNTRFISPSLQWPSMNSKNYNIRLARDKNFTQNLISIDKIPFTMINVHQPLEKGLWFWQFKPTDGNWSEIASFKIDSNSIDFVPPSFDKLLNSIPKSHPRLLVKKEEWGEIISKSKSYKESDNIIQQANKIILMKIPSERDAEIQFEGRDLNETNKIKKDFSKKVGSEFGKSLNF